MFDESKEDAEYKFGAGFKENEETPVDNVKSIAVMAFFTIQVFFQIQMCPGPFRNGSQSLEMSLWEIRGCLLQR